MQAYYCEGCGFTYEQEGATHCSDCAEICTVLAIHDASIIQAMALVPAWPRSYPPIDGSGNAIADSILCGAFRRISRLEFGQHLDALSQIITNLAKQDEAGHVVIPNKDRLVAIDVLRKWWLQIEERMRLELAA